MVVQKFRLVPASEVEDSDGALPCAKRPKALIKACHAQALKTVGMSDYATVIRIAFRRPAATAWPSPARLPCAHACCCWMNRISALDAQIRHNIVEEIARLLRELPNSLFSTSYDQTEALTTADKIGIMKDGSLIAHGETARYNQHPPNRLPPNS